MERWSPEAIAEVRRLSARQLTEDEVRQGLVARMNDAELGEAAELIRWFRRRYPTAGERLAFARRTYAQWKRSIPPHLASG